MKKKIIILISILVLCIRLNAQKPATYQNTEFLKGDFSYFISNYLLQKHSATYDTLCIKSCSFVSFIVGNNGKIDSLACNANTPKLLCDLFIEAVKSSEADWKILNFNKSNKHSSQRFILPITYFLYSKNCTIKDNTFESILKMIDFSGKLRLESMPFIQNNQSMINCVLLAPASFNSLTH
jgi:hypothetical protein